jgi:hypothetical protein
MTSKTKTGADIFLNLWLSGEFGQIPIPIGYLNQGRAEALGLISGCRILEIGISLYSKPGHCNPNMEEFKRQGRENLLIPTGADESTKISRSLNVIKDMVS